MKVAKRVTTIPKEYPMLRYMEAVRMAMKFERAVYDTLAVLTFTFVDGSKLTIRHYYYG